MRLSPTPLRLNTRPLRPVIMPVVAALVLAGCSGHARYVPPTGPMPPNTVLLSTMLQELSSHPGFTEAMLAQLDKGGKNGPALLTPRLVDTMRGLILGKDWEGLNRFPGWTMREINPTVRVVGHVVGKDAGAEELANPGPGANTTAAQSGSRRSAAAKRNIEEFIDLGDLGLERAQTINLDQPSRLPGFTEEGIVSTLGDGVARGDGPDPQLAPMHPESARLAYVLNRLSLNALDSTPQLVVTIAGKRATTPEQLLESLISTGHNVTVADARYFANFGHFHFAGKDVMMPFWVNLQILVPHTNRPLLVPVSHTEYEWFIHGPKVNAAVAFYFGIDGKAEFRTMDELNQGWVLNRHAHEYTGADAVEVTRLSGRMALAYIHQHVARPALPFGGYYALGVCQDGVAAIEKKMTGKATLFPNTADAALFNDPRDAEINALIAAIPKDRSGRRPEPERIFGSLPTENLQAITIPGLEADLRATQTAWKQGSLRHTHGSRFWTVRALEALGVLLATFVVYRLRRPVAQAAAT